MLCRSIFVPIFWKFWAINWQNKANVRLWCAVTGVFSKVLTSKVVKCKSLLKFVTKLLSFTKWAHFCIKMHSKWNYLVARGFWTHFSVSQVILNKFWKEKMDFLASEIGTKSECAKFINSVLPHQNFWKLTLKIKATKWNDYVLGHFL